MCCLDLFKDGSSTRITIATNTTAMFEADVVGRNQAGNENCGYRLKGVINNTGGNVSMVSTVVEEIIAENDVNWTATATADNTNDALAIKVTGDNIDIRWTAFVKLTSVTF